MLKAAQVGLGWWGSQVTKVLQGSEKIEIVCGVDPVDAMARKYEDDYGGYSHYTTCVLATNAGNVITYDDEGELVPPTGDNVVSLVIDGVPVDLTDDTATYTVSTVNYVAAGSCNFNDDGVTIWPLDQITHDTQLYVRDSVINYVEAQPGPIAPAVEGRLVFD